MWSSVRPHYNGGVCGQMFKSNKVATSYQGIAHQLSDGNWLVAQTYPPWL